MKAKSYSIAEVFDNAEIDFTYEFYSSKHTPFIVEQLSEILGKNVVLTGDAGYHPSPLNAILLKEYNGKRPRYQLKTGSMPYNDVNPRMDFTLMWMNENAVLDYSTVLKTRLSFNHRDLQTIQNISNMDIGKLVLKMDENYLRGRFPAGSESPFSMSIKRLVPLGNFINASKVIHDMKSVFQLPINEYFALDFTEYTRGSLTFNYICGEYASDPDSVKEALQYFVLTTYQALNENEYTQKEIFELEKLTEDYLQLKNLYYNSEKFTETFKDIRVMMDLNPSPQVLKSQWHMIRNPLFQVMFESGFRKGKFNWDSEVGSFQIKDAVLSGTKISGFDLVDCKVKGCILEDVHTWGTQINNSRVKIGTLVTKSKVEGSFLENVRADRTNNINKSIIRNNGEIINCKVDDSVIFHAGIGKNAKLEEGCTLIDVKDFRPGIKQGVEIKEIRDYRWIKSLGGEKEDKGFANEFKTDY
jgi:hypothetical protein